jgi:hypothetical protein
VIVDWLERAGASVNREKVTSSPDIEAPQGASCVMGFSLCT